MECIRKERGGGKKYHSCLRQRPLWKAQSLWKGFETVKKPSAASDPRRAELTKPARLLRGCRGKLGAAGAGAEQGRGKNNNNTNKIIIIIISLGHI